MLLFSYHYFILILILYLQVIISSHLNINFTENYPTAFSKNNRIIGFILAYDLDHIDPLMIIMNEYVSMCEGGWLPTIVLQTVIPWSNAMLRYMRARTYCYRIDTSINIRLDLYKRSVG